MGNDALAERIRNLEVPQGHLAVWALGQQGYILKGGRWVLAIDSYLSDYVEELTPEPPGEYARLSPAPVRPEELDMVDLALATHHHADHCDPHTLLPLMQAAPGSRLLTSHTGRKTALEAGLDMGRITVPPVDVAVDYGDGLAITAIPSAHYDFEPDEHGNPAFLGFIITLNGVTLYHSGDSIIYEGLVERLKAHSPDIVCLPINGRDWFRERADLVGNMDYREAAELAAAVEARVLLPGHNDMFRGNRINPSYLLDYLTTHHPQQRVHFLQAGELYYFAG
jgi:L-ascorbate metabolism protein UlaG (beta-lactamase superfamily)